MTPRRARHGDADWRSLVLLRNRAARPRGGIAEVEIETFLADVGVGPGSTPPERVRHLGAPRLAHGAVPLQMLATRRANRRTESPRHYPDNDLVEVRRVVAWVPPVAGYTVAPLPVDDVTGASPIHHPSVTGDSDTVDNGILRVHLELDRTISIAACDGSWSRRERTLRGERRRPGDLYTHSSFGPVRIEHAFFAPG